MSGSTGWPWSVLGLGKMPPDRAELRRAYARALKAIDPSTDIAGFADLREAYEAALAMRDGRDSRNAARKARREAARTPQAEPPQSQSPQLSPPLPAAPEDIARQAEEAGFARLLQATFAPPPDAKTAERLAFALDSPFMADPQRKAALGLAAAQLIRDSFALQPQDDPELPRAFTPALLQRLDREFGWLSDYAAFQQAFPFDTALQHEMLLRAHNGVLPQVRQAGRPGLTVLGRIWRVAVWLSAVIALISLNNFDFADRPLAGVGYGIAGLIVWLGVFPFHRWIDLGFQRRYHRLTSVLLTLLTILSLAFLLPLSGPAAGLIFVLSALACLALLCLLIALGPRGSPGLEAWLQALAGRLRLWR